MSQRSRTSKKPHRRHEARSRKIVEEEKMELHHPIEMFPQHEVIQADGQAHKNMLLSHGIITTITPPHTV